jgi:hypothetical protein
MTCGSPKSSPPSITVRPSAAEKARFARLADAAGMSEAALALKAIRAVLPPDGNAGSDSATVAEHTPSTDRITVRLRPGDAAALARRATQRGMKASTYLAALARAHLAANPPLAVPELAALKTSVFVLAGLGSALLQTSRATARGAYETQVRQQLSELSAAVTALERYTHDLARTSLMSWESRSG